MEPQPDQLLVSRRLIRCPLVKADDIANRLLNCICDGSYLFSFSEDDIALLCIEQMERRVESTVSPVISILIPVTGTVDLHMRTKKFYFMVSQILYGKYGICSGMRRAH